SVCLPVEGGDRYVVTTADHSGPTSASGAESHRNRSVLVRRCTPRGWRANWSPWYHSMDPPCRPILSEQYGDATGSHLWMWQPWLYVTGCCATLPMVSTRRVVLYGFTVALAA